MFLETESMWYQGSSFAPFNGIFHHCFDVFVAGHVWKVGPVSGVLPDHAGRVLDGRAQNRGTHMHTHIHPPLTHSHRHTHTHLTGKPEKIGKHFPVREF